MTDLTDVEAVRGALVLLCRDPRMRITGRSLNTANRWMPYSVRHPQTGMIFTDAGAWEYISDSIEGGSSLTCLPPTSQLPDHAYYLIEGRSDGRGIYMKVAIRPPLRKIIGLSFHYEDPR